MIVCKLAISKTDYSYVQVIRLEKPSYEYRHVGLVWGKLIIEEHNRMRIENLENNCISERTISYLHPDFIICSKEYCDTCVNKYKCWTDKFIYESLAEVIKELERREENENQNCS